jgi:hypothetical protein
MSYLQRRSGVRDRGEFYNRILLWRFCCFVFYIEKARELLLRFGRLDAKVEVAIIPRIFRHVAQSVMGGYEQMEE